MMRLSSWDLARSGCNSWGKDSYDAPNKFWWMIKTLWKVEKVCILNFNIVWILSTRPNEFVFHYHFLPVDCSDWTNKSDLSWDTDRWQLSALFITPACLYWRIESDFPFIWIGKVNSPQPWWCFFASVFQANVSLYPDI